MSDEPKKVVFDLTISLDRLEVELVRQVEMVDAASKRLALLRRKHTEAKNALELAEATIKRQIRKSPTLFGVTDGKTTEGAVNEAMVVHADYQNALTALNEAKYKLDIVDGLMTSLDHRKRALEKECDLWSQSYFSRPKTPDSAPPEARDKVQIAQKRLVRNKGKLPKTDSL